MIDGKRGAPFARTPKFNNRTMLRSAIAGALAAGASTLNVRPGQGLRLQLVNASAVRFMRLQLTTPGGALLPLRKIGGEGGLLNEAVTEGGSQGAFSTKFTAGEILLPPGTRADVVAAIPAAPTSGVLTLWTRDYSRTGLGFSHTATVPVMHLNLCLSIEEAFGVKLTPEEMFEMTSVRAIDAVLARHGVA